MLNVLLLESIYAGIIIACCLMVELRTARLYYLSQYNGIKYLGNACLAWGMGFFFRYINIAFSMLPSNDPFVNGTFTNAVWILGQYCFIIGGVYLAYSLVWKRFEVDEKISFFQPSRMRLFVAHAIAFVIAAFDVWQKSNHAMFVIVILSLIYISFRAIMYSKLSKNHTMHLYVTALIFGLIAYIINYIAYIIPAINSWEWIAHILTLFLFGIFVYGAYTHGKKA